MDRQILLNVIPANSCLEIELGFQRQSYIINTFPISCVLNLSWILKLLRLYLLNITYVRYKRWMSKISPWGEYPLHNLCLGGRGVICVTKHLPPQRDPFGEGEILKYHSRIFSFFHFVLLRNQNLYYIQYQQENLWLWGLMLTRRF